MARPRSTAPLKRKKDLTDGTKGFYYYERLPDGRPGRRLTDDEARELFEQANGRKPKAPEPEGGPGMKLGALLDQWQSSPHWRVRLAARTQENYRLSCAHRAVARLRGYRCNDPRLSATFFRVFHEEVAASGLARHGRLTEGVANSVVRALAAAWSWGEDYCNLGPSPLRRIRKKSPQKGFSIWNEDDFATWIAALPPRMARAVMLASVTALRQVDLLMVSWDAWDAKTGTLTWKPSKTKNSSGRTLTWELTPEMRARVDQWRADDLRDHGIPLRGTIVRNDDGTRMRKHNFNQRWSRLRAKHKLPEDRSLHGIRATVVVRMVEMGATDEQIMAVTGHTTAAALAPYKREVEQRRMQRASLAFLPNLLAKVS